MKLSIFADSKFFTDGIGNFYSSSNMRKAMLYPIANKCEKLYMVCRVDRGDLSYIAQEDLISHPKIEFLGVPHFRGVIGSVIAKKMILPKIRCAAERSDVCVLRFASNISCFAQPIARELQKPTIGHVVGEFDMEIRKNPKYIPIPVLRDIVANWTLKRTVMAFTACDILCGVTQNIAHKYSGSDREVFQILDSCLAEECYLPPQKTDRKTIKAIFAGRLVEFKNVQNFLRAIAKVRQERIDVDAVIVGEGNFKRELVKLAQKLDISPHVEFTGRIESRNKLWQKYSQADIGFLLSLSEGLPLGAIEPMSAGLPLIGAKLEYMEPVITDGIEGFLVDPNNIEEIAFKLKFLANNPLTRYEMALKAYEKARLFSAENQAIKLLELAEKVRKKV